MKRIALAAALLTASVCASAQGHRQLDSLAYILPQFAQGTVRFSDGQVKRGIINISPLDQAVYCITETRDTVTVLDYTSIVSVNVGGRSFFRWRGQFVENLAMDGDIGVGIVRSTFKISNVKPGAYGMTTATASIDSYAYDAKTGTFHTNIIDDPQNFDYKEIPILLKNGKYYIASKKSFIKLFPEQKSDIEAVWNERKVILSDINDVLSFYNELLQHP